MGGADFCGIFVGAVIVCIVLDVVDCCGVANVIVMGFGKLLSLGQVISVWVAADTFAVLTAPA